MSTVYQGTCDKPFTKKDGLKIFFRVFYLLVTLGREEYDIDMRITAFGG